MSKLKLLLRVQLTGLLGINKVVHSGDKKEKSKLIRFAVLMVFVAAMMLFSLVFYDFIFEDSFSKVGVPELMPALMMALASVITLFTTIYKVNGMIFGFRDYDMTMSLPVKTSVVVASRLLLLYLMNLGFSLFVNIPAALVYACYTAPPVSLYPAAIVLALFVPMVPMLIGTAVGLLISVATSRFRHANVVNIIFTLAMTLAAMSLSFAIPMVVTNAEAVSKMLMDSIYRIYPLTEMYTKALCKGSAVSLLLFMLISFLLFGIFAFAVGKAFKYLNTAFTTTRARSNYHMTALKASSSLSALYKRELRRFFSSALYVLNTSFGMVMALLMGGALLFFKPKQLEAMMEIPGLAGAVGSVAPMVLTILVCMSCTTACSISLEGKSLWIVKSLPVDAISVFKAKILVNLTTTVPLSIISALLLTFSIPMNFLQIIFLLITPIVFAVLTSEVGLFLNLSHPNFEWTSETQVIKQSMPAMVSVLGGMAVSIGLLIGLTKLPNSYQPAGLAVITASAAALDILLYRLLGTKGAKMFHEL